MKNKLNVWANLCKTGLAIMAVSAFVSCGNNKEFTSGRAEDAIEDLPMFQDSANVKLATMKKTMRLCVINYASWLQMKC